MKSHPPVQRAKPGGVNVIKALKPFTGLDKMPLFRLRPAPCGAAFRIETCLTIAAPEADSRPVRASKPMPKPPTEEG